MKYHRKIQLVATAVVVSGAVALGVLSPPAALAGTCTVTLKPLCIGMNYSLCVLDSQAQRLAYCQRFAAPGCTAYGSFCEANNWPGCPQGGIDCFYR